MVSSGLKGAANALLHAPPPCPSRPCSVEAEWQHRMVHLQVGRRRQWLPDVPSSVLKRR